LKGESEKPEGFFEKLRYAFRVEEPILPLGEEDLAYLRKIADAVVRRRLEVPAILFLESVRPLNFIGNQVMVFLKPIVDVVIPVADYDRIMKLLERRETIGRLIELIEEAVAEDKQREKEEKARKKAEKKAENKAEKEAEKETGA
jgi:hypothetical protein